MVNNARDLIKSHEGLRLTPYRDTLSNLTIGWGHLISAGENYPAAISTDQADAIFEKDYAKALAVCKDIFLDFDTYDTVRTAVMIDMAFNMGYNLRRFSRFIVAVATRNWVDAAIEMIDSSWARQVPVRCLEDVKLILSGRWK